MFSIIVSAFTIADENVDPPGIKSMNLQLDPSMETERLIEIRNAKDDYDEEFGSMEKTAQAIQNLFEILWYSQLPCFDIKDITSDIKDEMSVIKRCYWKDKLINCSSIFRTRPTDRGMCCSFNMEKAEEIFKHSQYGDMISNMQLQDLSYSFEGDQPPEWFVENKEPKSQAGRKKGLRLVLDAHSDRVSSGTISDNFRGFITVVDGKEKYPLTSRNSFTLSPGRENYIALSAFEIYADEGLKSINPSKRNCYFPDESPLDMHKNYSQANCILECSIMYARNRTFDIYNETCNPWFYPVTNDFVAHSCDPWETKDFQEYFNNLPDKICSHCLPDCTSTVYETRVSTAPFRSCDHTNLGVSGLCDFENDGMNPAMWRQQVQVEYNTLMGEIPEYVATNLHRMPSTRKFVKEDKVQSLTLKDYRLKHPTYDAFENDIAVANFYFDKSTIIRFIRAPRMTWTDYISQVGGLLGLAIGFSLCSLVEIIYWIVARLGKSWAIYEKENSKRYLSKKQIKLNNSQVSPLTVDSLDTKNIYD